MKPPETKIWFPAKRYGWGWGPPICWQGWVVLALWLGFTLGGTFAFLPFFKTHTILFLAYVWGLSLVLIGICYLKGEKPRWRWGKD